MRRREFITLLGGAAAWPVAARAQQPASVCGVLACDYARRSDPEAQARDRGIPPRLQELGWTEGAMCGSRSAGPQAVTPKCGDMQRKWSRLRPMSSSPRHPSVAALRQATNTVPVVFVDVSDPVGAGFVESLARPGGNATGFLMFEYSISGKWLELLKEIAPRHDARGGPSRSRDGRRYRPVRRHPGRGAVARVDVIPVNVRDAAEIEREIVAFAQRREWRPDPDGKRLVG